MKNNMKSDDGILNLSRIENKKLTSLYRYESYEHLMKLPESSKNSLFSNRFQNSTSAERLRKNLQAFRMNPIPNIAAHLKEKNLYEWEQTIQGPPNSPYKGGTFLLDMIISEDYPFKTSKVTFRTKVYHCNINSEGWISLDTLYENWTPVFSVDNSGTSY